MADFFFNTNLGMLLLIIGQILLVVVPLLIALAFLMYADRKVWAAVQMRRGPNVVGAFGLLQSFADFIKYIVKEIVVRQSLSLHAFRSELDECSGLFFLGNEEAATAQQHETLASRGGIVPFSVERRFGWRNKSDLSNQFRASGICNEDDRRVFAQDRDD